MLLQHHYHCNFSKGLKGTAHHCNTNINITATLTPLQPKGLRIAAMPVKGLQPHRKRAARQQKGCNPAKVLSQYATPTPAKELHTAAMPAK